MKKAEVAAKILGSTEVQEMLLINRSRLSALIKEGKLTPIKTFAKENVFWLPDVEKVAKEMMKNNKTNLYRQGGIKIAK